MKTDNLAATVSPLALMRVPMTSVERMQGRYMRAPEHEPPAPPADPSPPPPPADPSPPAPPADPSPPAPPADPSPPPPADPVDPADWRSAWAGEDKALLGFLGRYHSPDAAIKAWKTQHDDIRAGKWIKPLGDDASDDEKAAWAKFMGVPETPEAYLEKLPDGLVIGDDDKPAVDAFAKAMHAAGAPKGAVDAALQAYYEIVDDQMGAQSQANDTAKQAAEEALRAEWGADYKRNLNVLKSFMDTLPQEVSGALVGAVGDDGTQILNNPEVVKWLMGITLDQNPLATVVPGAGANQASAIADELAGIKAKMGTQAYIKDEKMQARYRELVAAQQKLEQRGG